MIKRSLQTIALLASLVAMQSGCKKNGTGSEAAVENLNQNVESHTDDEVQTIPTPIPPKDHTGSQQNKNSEEGNSGGPGNTNPSGPEAPSLAASVSPQISLGNELITIATSSSSWSGDDVAITVTQTAGTNVTLTPTGDGATFIAPDLANDEILSFEVKAVADDLETIKIISIKVLTSFAFLLADGQSGSNWEGSGYASEGYWFPRGNAVATGAYASYPAIGEAGNDDLHNLPGDLTISWPASMAGYVWNHTSAATVKGVWDPGETSGFESTLYHSTAVEVDVEQTGTRVPRIMRVYTTDHENSREMDIVILDKATQTELHRFEARGTDNAWRGASAGGYWLSYRIYDDVTVKVENITGTNSTLQGIVFDPVNAINSKPVANNKNQTIYASPGTLSVTALDSDGDTLFYSWKQTSGQAATIDDPSAASPSVSFPALGSYGFEVDVSDWSGASSKATVTVEYVVPPNPPTFLGSDATIGSEWLAAGYGSAGYWVAAAEAGATNKSSYALPGVAGNDDQYNLPDGVALSWGAGTNSYIWNSASSSGADSAIRPDGLSYIESCIYHSSQIDLDVTIGDAEARTIRIYLTDHEDNREMDVRIVDPVDDTVYHTFEARASDPNWRGAGTKGYWLSYTVETDVRIEIENISGANAILQAITWD
jgi:hypothetical protein